MKYNKKRIISLTLIFTIILSTLPIAAISSYQAAEEVTNAQFIVGDADSDDKITVKDATRIQKHIAKILTLTEIQKKAANFLSELKINIKCATFIQKSVAKFDLTGTDGEKIGSLNIPANSEPNNATQDEIKVTEIKVNNNQLVDNVEGYLEPVSDTVISGWAWNKALPNNSIDVELVITDKTGKEIIKVSKITAGQYCQDLPSKEYGNGYHRFTYDFEKDLAKLSIESGNYTVYVYGTSNGIRTQLKDSPKTITITNKIAAWLDSASSTEISGWAWNEALPNTPIEVELVIKDEVGREAAKVTGIKADKYRADLVNARYGNGYHGFNYNLSNVKLASGTYTVSVFGISNNMRTQLSASPKQIEIIAQTPGIENGGEYYLRNVKSGAYLDVKGAVNKNKQPCIQWHFEDGDANQKWKAIYQGDGSYKLQAMHTSNKYLEVTTNTAADKAVIDIHDGEWKEQYWRIKPNGDGSFRLMSKCSDYKKSAVVEGASFSDGAKVFQYSYNATHNDEWVFEKAWDATSDLVKKIVKSSGFRYDPNPKKDIAYTTIEAPVQRKLGYCDAYNNIAPAGFCIIDSEKILFKSGVLGEEYRIELWKGQYGITTGAEIGVYKRNSILEPINLMDVITGTKFYHCVCDTDLVKMSFTLLNKKTGKTLFEREQKHWWLTGFVLGEFTEPEELVMDNISFTFKNSDLAKAFATQLRTRYASVSNSGSTVTGMRFDEPQFSKQPDTRKSARIIIQPINEFNAKLYRTIKSEAGLQDNDFNKMPSALINLIKDNYINSLLARFDY